MILTDENRWFFFAKDFTLEFRLGFEYASDFISRDTHTDTDT